MHDTLPVESRPASRCDTEVSFMDQVAHDFRTPLAVIREYASIIDDELAGPVNAEQKQYLSVIMDRVRDLTGMVSDLQQISRMDAGRFGMTQTDVDIPRVLAEVNNTFSRKAATNRVHFEIHIDADIPMVYCDEYTLTHAVCNLTTFCVKSAREGTRIQWTIHRDVDKHLVSFSLTIGQPVLSGEKLRLLHEAERDEQTTVKDKTTGVGLLLNVAQELIRRNGSHLKVSNHREDGTVFSFKLPIADHVDAVSQVAETAAAQYELRTEDSLAG